MSEEERLVHRVNPHSLKRYREGKMSTVHAKCGKLWAPTVFAEDTESIPKCIECFPPPISKFAIAA